MARCIGILPAAGTGSRLQPFNYPKELLPVRFEPTNGGAELIPTLVIEHSLAAMQRAAVDQCVVVTSESKPEILRYLGDGTRYGIPIAYVVQVQQLGLAHAVDQAHFWGSTLGCNCCLALPDTVFWPVEAVKVIKQELLDQEADLVLGVFPTMTPQDLGPVKVAGDGRIEAVYDKPAQAGLMNTWAIAAWTPRFSDLVHEQILLRGGKEVVLGAVFDLACRSGLNARAVMFPEGAFHDLGTPFGLTRILRANWDESNSETHRTPGRPSHDQSGAAGCDSGGDPHASEPGT
jgi:glucose-1-phosphate thymidylyltransferase